MNTKVNPTKPIPYLPPDFQLSLVEISHQVFCVENSAAFPSINGRNQQDKM